MNRADVDPSFADEPREARALGAGKGEIELGRDTALEDIEMFRQREHGLHHVQIVHDGGIERRERLGEKIGLFLIVAFEADAVAGFNHGREQPADCFRRRFLAGEKRRGAPQARGAIRRLRAPVARQVLGFGGHAGISGRKQGRTTAGIMSAMMGGSVFRRMMSSLAPTGTRARSSQTTYPCIAPLSQRKKRSGSQSAIPGKSASSAIAPTISTRNGTTPHTMSRSGMSGAMPLITNRLRPTGGWISPISIRIVMMTPNQMRSKPCACSPGRMIGVTIKIIATGGRKKPNTTSSTFTQKKNAHLPSGRLTSHSAALWVMCR